MSFFLDTGTFTYNCVNSDNFVTNNYYENAKCKSYNLYKFSLYYTVTIVVYLNIGL